MGLFELFSISSCLSFSMIFDLYSGQIDFYFGCKIWFINGRNCERWGWIMKELGDEWLYEKVRKIMYM